MVRAENCLDKALRLAAMGFHVFPCEAGGKNPVIGGFPAMATRCPDAIKAFWTCPITGSTQDFNVGISTSRFGDNEALVAIDVDNKEGKTGDDDVFMFELEGFEFPKTFEQLTPTGGRHFLYRVPKALRQPDLSPSINTRSRGGYVVGSGSIIADASYSDTAGRVVECPAWIVERIGQVADKAKLPEVHLDINEEYALERARYYLEHEAPFAISGQGGNNTTFQVACRVKDMGVSEEDCQTLLCSTWNDFCSPPWTPQELDYIVGNAYQYGREPVGVAAPEMHFQPVVVEEPQHPFDKLNENFAFVIAGGGHHVLWETKDAAGKETLEHLSEVTFHRKFAAERMTIADGKTESLTRLWMNSARRRSYDGFCFRPEQPTPNGFYNLWRGFAYEPGNENNLVAKKAVNDFIEHAKNNVCQGDPLLFRWLMGYFAHLIQRPWEKPLVALVFRGAKGVGKNALIDCVGNLLGNHYLLTSNRRYLVGNFNGHLENCLLFALDEAFWSGDKQAEGTLKDLITGNKHVIEHKGKETYTVENCTRVCIIGNEEWLVPATQDERRFAVFSVGDGRKQDRAFFQSMREGMEAGGYGLLLRYLQEFSLEGIDVNEAPSTEALLDQKMSSLSVLHQWWFESLSDGRLAASDYGAWSQGMSKERFRLAFQRYVKDRQIRSRVPGERSFVKELSICVPISGKGKVKDGEEWTHGYRVPTLGEARRAWEKFIGHEVEWENNEDVSNTG